jgi:pimeloyl-ACP methyl ester carboxylesterase
MKPGVDRPKSRRSLGIRFRFYGGGSVVGDTFSSGTGNMKNAMKATLAVVIYGVLGLGMLHAQATRPAQPPVAPPKVAPPAVTPPAAPPAVTPPVTTPPAAAPKAAPPAAAPAEEAVAVEPKEMSINTEDGVAIKFSYYASGTPESVPVILLHGGGGKRDDLRVVAEYLSAQGHSVVLPDLRGHGESTEQTKGGRTITLSHKTQNRNDIASMVTHDMTKLWNFLLKENNDKVVNIKKLCVVGVDMGAIVALNFAAKNYTEKDYRNQTRGKDVKALVLVSPPSAYRGASYNEAVKQPCFKGEISSLVVVGEEGSAEKTNAKQLEGILAKFAGAAANAKEKPVLYAGLKTKLQAAQLLSNPQLKLMGALDGFIRTRLFEKAIPWKEQIAF